jgi:hypothetical protein
MDHTDGYAQVLERRKISKFLRDCSIQIVGRQIAEERKID